MNILTDEEIFKCLSASIGSLAYARAIEAAVLSKLAEQAGEPVADVVWFDPALELFTERKPYKIIDGSLAFMDTAELGTKLFTEAQLLSAQQRTAEACAKVCNSRASETQEDEADKCADYIRDGHWREYL